MKVLTSIGISLLCIINSQASYLISRDFEITLNTDTSSFLEDWGPKRTLVINDDGIGFDKSIRSSIDSWIVSKPVAVSLYHKTLSATHITVEIDSQFGKFTDDGMRIIVYPGDAYIRYSPDQINWTSWMPINSHTDRKYSENVYEGATFKHEISVPQINRKLYDRYYEQYMDLGLYKDSKNGEEDLVLWMLEQDKDIFTKEISFIGYIQILYEHEFHGGIRLRNIKVHTGIGVSGLSMFQVKKNKDSPSSPYWRLHELISSSQPEAQQGGSLQTSQSASLQTSQSASNLELRVYTIDLEHDKFGDQKKITVYAEIQNIGQTTVTLPTKVSTSISGNAAFVNITFIPLSLLNKDGSKRALSLADYAPAEVRPGEHITVTHTFEKPAPAGARITYRVSKEFADRYEVWHGELKSEHVSLRD